MNSLPHKMGYARVSTSDQDLRMQRDALIAAGVDPRDIWEEKVSGATVHKRREFQAMLKDIRAGDIIYVWKLDRLARSVLDLHATAKLIAERGAHFRVLTMPELDTTTSHGRFMFTMLGAVAEFEKDLGHERTMAGLHAAKARGRVGGRKSAFTDAQVLALAELRPRDAAARLKLTPSGFTKRLAKALSNAAHEVQNAA